MPAWAHYTPGAISDRVNFICYKENLTACDTHFPSSTTGALPYSQKEEGKVHPSVNQDRDYCIAYLKPAFIGIATSSQLCICAAGTSTDVSGHFGQPFHYHPTIPALKKIQCPVSIGPG
jgi:hypothetical protein